MKPNLCKKPDCMNNGKPKQEGYCNRHWEILKRLRKQYKEKE